MVQQLPRRGVQKPLNFCHTQNYKDAASTALNWHRAGAEIVVTRTETKIPKLVLKALCYFVLKDIVQVPVWGQSVSLLHCGDHLQRE